MRNINNKRETYNEYLLTLFGHEHYHRGRAVKNGAPAIEKVDRLAIIERDKGICYICGGIPDGRDLTLDHLIPVKRQGPHTADNLKVACRGCNSKKQNLLPHEITWADVHCPCAECERGKAA
jgi:5-methylcytosine-specific restriction endonuclease McrA